MKTRAKYNRAGLTLVELLVALMVCSIIFGAVATLAYAMGTANKSSDESSRVQAQVRYTTLRISELLRYAGFVVLSGSDDLAVWRADDNNDNQINPSEVVYIEAGSGRDKTSLLEFPSAGYATVSLADLKDGTAKSSLMASYDERRIEIIPQCSNVVFEPATIDEQTRLAGVGFDIDEAGIVRHYEASSYLRCWAGHLLDGSSIVVSDDD